MTTGNSRSRYRRLLALCTLLAAGAVGADEPTEPAGQDASSGNSGGSSSETSAPAAAGGGSDDSPFDYEASEQISEDLSVSFPVDI